MARPPHPQRSYRKPLLQPGLGGHRAQHLRALLSHQRGPLHRACSSGSPVCSPGTAGHCQPPAPAHGDSCPLRAQQAQLTEPQGTEPPVPVPEVIILAAPAPEGIGESVDLLELLDSQATHPPEELVVREPEQERRVRAELSPCPGKAQALRMLSAIPYPAPSAQSPRNKPRFILRLRNESVKPNSASLAATVAGRKNSAHRYMYLSSLAAKCLGICPHP